MKNSFFTLIAVAALTFTLASCKKDRTCTCTDESGDVTKTEYKKVTKNEADCYSGTYTVTYGSITETGTRTCELD